MGVQIDEPALGSSIERQDILDIDNKTQTLNVGLAQVSLSNWNNSSQPQVVAGSVYEISGAFYTESTNATVSSWTASGTRYLYASVSGTTTSWALSATSPSWSETKQGWYNGADRAFYKIVDGLKYKLIDEHQTIFAGDVRVEGDLTVSAGSATVQSGIHDGNAILDTGASGGFIALSDSDGTSQLLIRGYESDGVQARFEAGDVEIYGDISLYDGSDDVDRTIRFASDAKIEWSESDNTYRLVDGTMRANLEAVEIIRGSNVTEAEVYDAMEEAFPTTSTVGTETTGRILPVRGVLPNGSVSVMHAWKSSATTYTFRIINIGSGAFGTITVTSGIPALLSLANLSR